MHTYFYLLGSGIFPHKMRSDAGAAGKRVIFSPSRALARAKLNYRVASR